MKFHRNEDGHVAIMFALVAAVATGVTGMAIDYGRAMSARDHIQAAADAAAMAGLALTSGTDQQRIDKATATFNANLEGYDLATKPTPVVTSSGGTVTVSVDATIGTAFSSLVGVSSLSVHADASASSSGQSYEVALVIDLTGSMGETRNGATKISGLRTAANDLLDILLPTSGANNNTVRVAVAPFADYVNAGSYAATVTGLAATGGSYANVSNLASTKNGNYTGSYSGLTGNSSGSQAGATPPTSGASSGASGSTTSAGSTYSNGYCSVTTQNVSTTMTTNAFGTAAVGSPVNYGQSGSVNGAFYWKSSGTWYYISNVGTYYGTPYGYLYYQSGNNWYKYNNSMYYNSYQPTTTTQTVPGCENTVTAQSSSQLISCVTERMSLVGTLPDYTDTVPGTNAYIGSYNAGSNSKSNYSSDGKCYTAGRELPSIIPLTNSRTTISNFFTNATIGGGTPGHLGTAWGWYLLSPNWATIWPTGSKPVAYNTTSNTKAVIIMTDGEYNEQYSSTSSAVQALAQCTAMKAQGIKVYTVGFGFSQTAVLGANSADGQAMQLLYNCAGDKNNTKDGYYFVPYDGAALRTAFQSIGNSLTAAQKTARFTQ